MIDGAKYIKLTGAKTGHLYEVEYYTECGKLIDNDLVDLKMVDKLCPKHIKLRVRTGVVWGILTYGAGYGRSILPINLPKFMTH